MEITREYASKFENYKQQQAQEIINNLTWEKPMTDNNKKSGGMTVAFNGDFICEMLPQVVRNTPRYEYLTTAQIIRLLVLEGCNRVYGDSVHVDFIKATKELKQAIRDRDRNARVRVKKK